MTTPEDPAAPATPAARPAPRVSLVVPTYNNADYVEDTLRSLLAQTYTDVEIVVSDHSSTDGTWDLLQPFAADPRVRLSQIPTGGGAKANWDAVCALATGEYLKLVPGDDVIYPDCVAEQVEALDAHPTAVLVACTRDIVDADGTTVVRGRGLGGMQGLVDGRRAVRRTVRLGTNIFGEPGCVLLRREALVALGGWDDSHPYLIDQYTYSLLLLHGDLVALPRSLAFFRVNAGQWSVRLARQQSAQAAGVHEALRRAEPGLIRRRDVIEGDARAALTALLRRTAYAYLRRRMARTAAGA